MLARDGVLVEADEPGPAVIHVAAVEPVAFFFAGFFRGAEFLEAGARVGGLFDIGEAGLQARAEIGEVDGVAQGRADGGVAGSSRRTLTCGSARRLVRIAVKSRQARKAKAW